MSSDIANKIRKRELMIELLRIGSEYAMNAGIERVHLVYDKDEYDKYILATGPSVLVIYTDSLDQVAHLGPLFKYIPGDNPLLREYRELIGEEEYQKMMEE